MKNWKIYKHIFPNGKIYIGITGCSCLKRWDNGRGYCQQKVGKAIKKYGWENVDHFILEENLSLEQALEKEKEYIEKFHSYIHDPVCNGYNMTQGGDRYPIYERNKKYREKVSKIHKKWCSEHESPVKKKIYQFDLDGNFFERVRKRKRCRKKNRSSF